MFKLLCQTCQICFEHLELITLLVADGFQECIYIILFLEHLQFCQSKVLALLVDVIQNLYLMFDVASANCA